MAEVRQLLDGLATVSTRYPAAREMALSTVNRLVAELDGMPEEFAKTYQYPELYGKLAEIALNLNDPALAATLAGKAIAIDPLQPEALVAAAIAAAVDNGDASSLTEQAVALIRDPVWDDATGTYDMHTIVATAMIETLDRHLDQYPDHRTALDRLRATLYEQLPSRPSAGGRFIPSPS
jgi:hypothetical protein